MNLDDYAIHIYQRHRVAVAIAVLKTKHKEITIEDYINQIKSNLEQENNMDVDELDVVIDSDDFDEEIFENMINNISKTGEYDVQGMSTLNDYKNYAHKNSTDLSQLKLKENCTIADEYNIISITSNTDQSQSILEDYNENAPSNVDPLQSQPIFNESCSNNDLQHKNNDIDLSQSILKDYVVNNDVSRDITSDIDFMQNRSTFDVESFCEYKNINETQVTLAESQKIAEESPKNNTQMDLVQNTDTTNCMEVDTQQIDSQRTQLYDVDNINLTQILTHISQTQEEPDKRFEILQKYVIGVPKKKKPKDDKTKPVIEDHANVCNKKDTERMNNSQNNTNDYVKFIESSSEPSQSQLAEDGGIEKNLIAISTEKGGKENKTPNDDKIKPAINDNGNVCDKKDSERMNNSQNKMHDYVNFIKSLNEPSQSQLLDYGGIKKNSVAVSAEKGSQENLLAESQEAMDFEENKMDSRTDILIPFKIINALNVVKQFLTKRDEKNSEGFSPESGYKSDSQNRYSAIKIDSDQFLNEAAYSLANYLMDCQLSQHIHTIVEEISQVLANLIDKLHSEESYPKFLDIILEKINSFLDELRDGDSCGETVIPVKNEITLRLLLLNHSSSILSFTIDKITQEIENFHTNLTKGDVLYEISNIKAIENISYVFHILEILLKRYMKKKSLRISSQTDSQISTQSLKKSSISDIWKKKWDPNFKKEQIEMETRTDSCVLLKVSTVLKSIILDCTEQYSLVSFLALQCFNHIQ